MKERVTLAGEISNLGDFFPKCVLPTALDGDIPETNKEDFFNFLKEKAPLVEEKYAYLKQWTRSNGETEL